MYVASLCFPWIADRGLSPLVLRLFMIRFPVWKCPLLWKDSGAAFALTDRKCLSFPFHSFLSVSAFSAVSFRSLFY